MLKAIVISNNIVGLDRYFQSGDEVTYTIFPITKAFNPDLSPYDLLVVPNGSDHVAMLKIKNKVKDFLDEGKSLICCDGWFTNWIPANQWVMDNSKKSVDTRYFIKDDPYHFFNGLHVEEFIFSHGISGYWACGYIRAAAGAHVILEDSWQRPVIVLDEVSTKGSIFLTASGPLADIRYDIATAGVQENSLALLYRKYIRYLINRKQLSYA